MKKTLFLLAIAAAIFYSCKKEHGLNVKTLSAKKYAINIRVANFTTSHGNFALRTKASHLASSSDTVTNLASYVDLFYYVVMDRSLHTIKIITQDSTMANMGMITDSLPAGDYIIALIAGKNGLNFAPVFASTVTTLPMYGYANQPWPGSFWSAYPDGYIGSHWQDTFEDAFQITVGNQNINQAVTLKRVVGKLEFTFLDNMPANADNINISFGGPGPAFVWYNEYISVKNDYQFAIPASAKGKPNFTVDILLFNNLYFDGGYNPDGYTITCKDAGGNVLGTTKVNPVPIYANEKTILSGNLFTPPSPSSQSFTTQIDTAWSSGVTQVGFSLKHH